MNAVQIAADLTRHHEGCSLHAYPDPLSPLAQALGARGRAAVMRGERVPANLAHLSGHPWTIGWGESSKVDPHIVAGLRWTQAEADRRLLLRLNAFWDQVQRVWPGATRLHPKAAAALISLAYNRGTSLVRRPGDALDRRREMRELLPAVVQQDYRRMADLFRGMKRLWVGQGVDGLIRRREDEARLCDEAGTDG